MKGQLTCLDDWAPDEQILFQVLPVLGAPFEYTRGGGIPASTAVVKQINRNEPGPYPPDGRIKFQTAGCRFELRITDPVLAH